VATPSSLRFVIRDGVAGDIPACVQLNHSFETDMVLQLQVYNTDANRWEMTLREERLPRKIEVQLEPNEKRLRAALPAGSCFLAAVSGGVGDLPPELFGYLAMHADTADGVGIMTDIVVSRPYRRSGVGARLVNVARRWAKEYGLGRLTIPTQTKNYPGVRFCQALGFTFCGFNDRYYANQDIAIFFSQSVR
jgi:GNAT superfamily N-acetyltransferase